MTASPATRSKDFRERRKAKLARADAMGNALAMIAKVSTIAVGTADDIDMTTAALNAIRIIAINAFASDPPPKQGQPA